MTDLTGEKHCKVDAKGRILFPVELRRKLSNIEKEGLIFKRGIEKNLEIWTKDAWSKEKEYYEKRLDRHKSEQRQLLRSMTMGVQEVSLDSAGRISIPKKMLDYAGIKDECVLGAVSGRIEVWATEAYNEFFAEENMDILSELSNKYLGNQKKEEGEDE